MKIKFAIVLFFIMFIYSGIMKIKKFDKKTSGLMKKTKLPLFINQLGMIGVIILEILGSIIIINYFLTDKKTNKQLVKRIVELYLLFLIVVTILYHPPKSKAMIPFLSNLTTFSGLLIIYNIL
tara:strand:- start:323 stop:691 length:369 start_codon:yes stop_codon:yes gene_type:complete